MNSKTVIVRDKNGKEMFVPLRNALPVNFPCARYTGFKPETLLLKSGSDRLNAFLGYEYGGGHSKPLLNRAGARTGDSEGIGKTKPSLAKGTACAKRYMGHEIFSVKLNKISCYFIRSNRLLRCCVLPV